MKTIVSYDVSTTDSGGPGRLRKVAKACKSYGVRVQYSVFECSLTDKEWLLLKPVLLGVIMDHFVSGRPVLVEDAEHGHASGDDSEVVAQIKDLLDTRIRPAVAQDGGDITFLKFEDGIVYLNMRGSCAGCPSSTATLKNGIENMLRHYIPEVQEVRAGR